MLTSAGGPAGGRRGGSGAKTAALRLVRESLDDERSQPPARTRPASGPRGARDIEETDRARELCLSELDRAPRTRSELAAVLTRKEIAPDVADAVLDRLTEAGLIDDAAFAESWVSTRQRSKGLAKGQLAQELRRRGVQDEVVADAVAAIAPEDELAAARALIERKRHATRGLDPQVRMRRLAGLLARKGYSPGVAFSVVREALADEDAAGADLAGPPD